MTLEIVVPARDEAPRLPALLSDLRHLTDCRVTVVDNASLDATTATALRHGARVLSEPQVGKGFAVFAGLARLSPGRVFLCDADISGLRPPMLRGLLDMADLTGAPVVRLAIGRAAEAAPVTTLTALPLLAAFGIDRLREPLGGLVLVESDFILSQHLPGGWGFDVALSLAAYDRAGVVPELPVQGVSHRRRALDQYRAMAGEVASAILKARQAVPWDHRDCIQCATRDSPMRRQSTAFAEAHAGRSALIADGALG